MDRSTLREHDAVLLAEHSWYIFLGSQSGLPGGFSGKTKEKVDRMLASYFMCLCCFRRIDSSGIEEFARFFYLMILNRSEKEFSFSRPQGMSERCDMVSRIYSWRDTLAVCCSKLLHKDSSSETLSVHSANHHTRPKDMCQQMPTTQGLESPNKSISRQTCQDMKQHKSFKFHLPLENHRKLAITKVAKSILFQDRHHPPCPAFHSSKALLAVRPSKV